MLHCVLEWFKTGRFESNPSRLLSRHRGSDTIALMSVSEANLKNKSEQMKLMHQKLLL